MNFAIEKKFREHDIEIPFRSRICTFVPVVLKLKKPEETKSSSE